MLAAAGLVSCGTRGSAAQAGDFDLKQAKKACETFINALTAKDLDALIKVTAVPWYDNFEQSRVLLKRDDLDKELQKFIAKIKAPAKVVVEFKETLTYELVLEKFGGDIPPEERKLLDQVLKKSDYVLRVEIQSPDGEQLGQIVMLVGLRDGHARVVGLRSK
jgi:hypothetical protein